MVLVLSDIPRPCPKASLLPLATIQLLVQACVLRWLGSSKSIVSVVLVANDISFAIMVAIFTTIGSVADYSTFGRWLLFTVALSVVHLYGRLARNTPFSQSTCKV